MILKIAQFNKNKELKGWIHFESDCFQINYANIKCTNISNLEEGDLTTTHPEISSEVMKVKTSDGLYHFQTAFLMNNDGKTIEKYGV